MLHEYGLANGSALDVAQKTVDTILSYILSILLLLVLCQGAEEATWLSSKALPTFISGINFYLRFNITSLAIVPTLSQNLSKPTDKRTRKLINTPIIQAINIIVMNWETFLEFYLRSLGVLSAYYLQAWMYTCKENNCLKWYLWSSQPLFPSVRFYYLKDSG